MDLYKEILINVLKNKKINVNFVDLKVNAEEIIEIECYKALYKIKNIVLDNNFKYDDCIIKIEKIINVFEEIGNESIY